MYGKETAAPFLPASLLQPANPRCDGKRKGRVGGQEQINYLGTGAAPTAAH